ncbi:hypothetical protein EVAR_92316_1 [Eumeta japonica]|uniref:Uncharacterized protein n=1 Tax=Eumeta variegata TaxID=151549 RepID=A0A4C1TII2_EUMVA|nr:hypothetical protein EVAR_92316_1 [Eumeta japonica]
MDHGSWTKIYTFAGVSVVVPLDDLGLAPRTLESVSAANGVGSRTSMIQQKTSQNQIGNLRKVTISEFAKGRSELDRKPCDSTLAGEINS